MLICASLGMVVKQIYFSLCVEDTDVRYMISPEIIELRDLIYVCI
jgi:hypothetical protein